MIGEKSYNQIAEEDDPQIELVFNPFNSYNDLQSIHHSMNNNIIDTDMAPKLEKPTDEVNIASWSSCYINLTSTCIGAGIIGIPFAFSKAGWVLGTFLILTSSTLSFFGSHLLSICAKRAKTVPSSFYTVAEATIPQYSFVIDICIAIKCFGVTASYLCIIGDSLTLAMEHLQAPAFFQLRSVCILLGFVVIAPLSFMPSLDALKFTSWLSGAMLLYMVLLIFLYACHIPSPLFDPCLDVTDGTCKGEEALALWDVDTVRVLSIFIFNFSCQQNVFTIVNELHDPTPQRLDSIFAATMGTAVVLYIITTFSAYSTFGSLMDADIITMYPNTALTTLCRFLVSLIVALHYPLQLNPARKSTLSLIRYMLRDGDRVLSGRVAAVRHNVVTAGHLALTLLVALSFSDLGVTFQICGATGSTLVIFILPGMFYYLLHRDDHSLLTDRAVYLSVGDEDVSEKVSSRKKLNGRSSSSSSRSSSGGEVEALEGQVVSSSDIHLRRAALKQPLWKLYASMCMLGLGCIIVPLCLTLIFMDMVK